MLVSRSKLHNNWINLILLRFATKNRLSYPITAMRNTDLTLLFVLYLNGCDAVEKQYPTLKDARQDRLFERGWLPDMLPASTKNITTINDRDINTSRGQFFFAPSDFDQFAKYVKAGAETSSKGYSAYKFACNQNLWLFSCEAVHGHCNYEKRPTSRAVNK